MLRLELTSRALLPAGTTSTTTISSTGPTAKAVSEHIKALGGGGGEYEALVMPKPPGPEQLNEWVAQCQEKPLEPLQRILDCHHHFFDWSKVAAGANEEMPLGSNEIPTPPPFLQAFTNLPALEPTFGVRNMVFETRESHDQEEWLGGVVKAQLYGPEEMLADMAGNNVVGTLCE